MNILFVQAIPIGHFSNAAPEYFSKGLAQLGHTVTFVGRPGNTQPYAGSGVRVIELPGEGPGWYRRLAALAREVRPQIVHVKQRPRCGIIPWMLRMTPRPRFIVDIRNPMVRANGDLWRIPILQLSFRLQAMQYDAIAAHYIPSAYTVLGRVKHCYHLPMGVDLANIPPRSQAPAATPGQARLLYLGNRSRVRQLHKLIAAFDLARREVDIRLDMIGDGDDTPNLVAQVEALGLGDRVRILGPLPRQELYARLGEYDIGLGWMPTLFGDMAPPLKTAESMAAGLPVLATNTEGNRYWIEHGRTGFLAGEAPEEFAAGMVALVKDAPLRERLAAVARDAVASHDWPVLIRTRLLPLYEALLAGRRPY